jgi:hypothetical protein
VLLSLGVGALVVMGRRQQQEQRQYQKSVRLRTKVRIGDNPQTVRLRLGIAADTARNEETSVWVYQDGTDLIGVIYFDRGRVDEVSNSRYGWWTPEDGLSVSRHSDVNRTLDEFENGLGVPCDTTVAETSVTYFYRLSPQELAEDSVYRTWNRGDSSKVVRYLSIDLKGGKKVDDHGWALVKSYSAENPFAPSRSSCLR